MHELIQSARIWVASGHWVTLGGRLVAAAAIMGGAFLLTRVLSAVLERFRRRSSHGASLLYIVEKVSVYAILLVAVLSSLSTLGANLSSFSVFAGATGVGLGLGLQGIVREFFSGLVLIFDSSIRVGDFVETDTGVRGEIVEVGARATRLRTNDALYVVIPNSKMTQSQVTNCTFSDTSRRIHVPFSVIASADKARVREVVLTAAKALPFTLPDHERRNTQVWLTGFSGAGMNFELIVWPTLRSSRHPASMHAAYTWAIHDALLAAQIDTAPPPNALRIETVAGVRRAEKATAARRPDAKQPPARRRGAKAEASPNDALTAVFDEANSDDRAREIEHAEREARRQGAVPSGV
ncbi:MAG TPA: mechanosensitive ion channel domain-containing protein [Phenylobacterium sp.]|nr:mechanosensitive ion channel domain-containing protein [Phenylobacterium sp.]